MTTSKWSFTTTRKQNIISIDLLAVEATWIGPRNRIRSGDMSAHRCCHFHLLSEMNRPFMRDCLKGESTRKRYRSKLSLSYSNSRWEFLRGKNSVIVGGR